MKPSIGTSNTASYLLAYCILNMIIKQDERVIGRLNRARFMWSLIKANSEYRKSSTSTSIDERFQKLRREYITAIDENPEYVTVRSEYELQLDDTIDLLMGIVDEYKLVSQSMLVEIDGYDYANSLRKVSE